MLEAIVLAGGAGTRLRQVLPDLPKPMAPIAGRPFLEILLGRLSARGIQRVVLSLGYMADKIRTHFGDRYSGMDLDYAIEDRPLGTGGAARLALEHCREDHVFVFNGDTFLDLDIEAVEHLWLRRSNPIIIGREVADTARYGRLQILDGQVVGFTEKGLVGPGVINAGCYVLKRGQLDEFPLQTAFSLEIDHLASIVPAVPVDVYVSRDYFIDIGIPADFQRAQVELAAWAINRQA